jgi:endonuclease/exonuclease/phosphatase (EEP) superfamily protein YafD
MSKEDNSALQHKMLDRTVSLFSQKLLSAGRNVFWLVVWLMGLGLILIYPLRWFSGDSLKPVRMISYITPWLLVISLPFLIIAGMSRRKWLSAILATATLANILSFAPLFLPRHSALASADDFSLKIMSYNMHGIPKVDGVLEVIRQEKPDILLIQECSPALAAPSFHGLDDLYPASYVDQKGFGQAILSRYPLKQMGAESDTGRTLKVLIQTPVGPIAVWNTHPIPPFLVPPQKYDAQISALAAEISKATGPLIVGGDFNATDQTEAYRKIHRDLEDAYREAGKGFGFTYPAPPYTFMDMHLQTGPLWRIDHIFHSSHFIATSARTLTSAGGSDHFPIVVELSMAK